MIAVALLSTIANGGFRKFASANARVSTSQSSETKPILSGNYRPAPAPALDDISENEPLEAEYGSLSMSLDVSLTFTRFSRSALLLLGVAGLLINGPHLLAQNAPIPFLDADAPCAASLPHKGPFCGIEILTDTRGVDFGPYIKQVIQKISEGSSTKEIGADSDHGRTGVISFTITPDGKISALHLDESSRDSGLDRAAWQSITQAKTFPPLPKDFHGASLSLRVHYSGDRMPAKAS
jgi:TonB family protein